jgi:hypothetical protein
MRQSTSRATDALGLIQEGLNVISVQDDDFDLTGVAVQMLQCMGALTDEWSQEFFTDDEVELITESTVACLEQLMTSTQQGEL